MIRCRSTTNRSRLSQLARGFVVPPRSSAASPITSFRSRCIHSFPTFPTSSIPTLLAMRRRDCRQIVNACRPGGSHVSEMPFHRILARSGNLFESFKVSIISLELIHRLLLMFVEATLSSLVLKMVVVRFVNSILSGNLIVIFLRKSGISVQHDLAALSSLLLFDSYLGQLNQSFRRERPRSHAQTIRLLLESNVDSHATCSNQQVTNQHLPSTEQQANQRRSSVESADLCRDAFFDCFNFG